MSDMKDFGAPAVCEHGNKARTCDKCLVISLRIMQSRILDKAVALYESGESKIFPDTQVATLLGNAADRIEALGDKV